MKGDGRLQATKTFGIGVSYTMEFANLFIRELLKCGGIYTSAMRAIRSGWQAAGCQVVYCHMLHLSVTWIRIRFYGLIGFRVWSTIG